MKSLILIFFILLSPLTWASETAVSLPFKDLTLSGKIVLSGNQKLPGNAVVLLLHGTLSHYDSEIISELQALLAEYGLNSLSINLSLEQDDRKGPFACNSKHFHQHEDAKAELKQWMVWLKKQGVEKIHLLGHSRGGHQIAQFYAENHSAIQGKVVLIAPLTFSGQLNAAQAKQLKWAKQQVKSGQPQALKAVDAFLHCGETQVSAQSVMSYLGDDKRKDTPTVLAEISKPVLVVYGNEDPLAKALPQGLAEKSPHHPTAIIDGADHFFRDFYAEELVELIVDWYQSK